MLFIVGTIVVFGCVFGGYMLAGGHMAVIWQPFEFLIILGAGVGAFVIGNSKAVLGGVGGAFGTLIKGPNYGPDAYLEVLGVLYSVFKLAKSKGDLALESHVENPGESEIFKKFPLFSGDHHAVEFFCDYLRMLTLGTSSPHEIEAIMDQELEFITKKNMIFLALCKHWQMPYPPWGLLPPCWVLSTPWVPLPNPQRCSAI